MVKSESELKQVMTFRGNVSDKEAIKTLANAWGCTKGEAIRQSIKLVIELADEINDKDLGLNVKKRKPKTKTASQS